MKKTIEQIHATNSVAYEIGLSPTRFYKYIEDRKVTPDYCHISKNNLKFYYFSNLSLRAIKKWHSDFKKSKLRKIGDMK